MKLSLIAVIALAIATSACVPRPNSNAHAYQFLMQSEADLQAENHMALYDLLSLDASNQAAQARFILLALLDGYQKQEIVLEAPPHNYTYPATSRAALVASFLESHAEDRKQLEEMFKSKRHNDSSSRVRPIPK